MKKRRFLKALALMLAFIMSASMAFYSNANLAKAAGNTVTFKNGSTTVEKQTVNSGSTATNIDALEEDGLLFAGWFTQNVGEITDVASALNYAYDFSSAVTSDITLYAGWINVGTGEDSHFYLQGVQYRPVTDTVTAGIRFITKIDDSLVEDVIDLNSANSGIRPTSSSQTGIGYGTVLTYVENLKNGDMLVKDTSAKGISSGFYVVPAVKSYVIGSDYRSYTALVVGIPEAYYTQHIAARPYITYADANGEIQTYYYTETSNTTHKLGGAYYINYKEAVNNALDDDAIKPEPSTEESTETTTEETSQYVPVYTGGYDLAVTGIKWSPENPSAGSQVLFTVTVINDGDRDIPAGTTIGCQVQIDGNTSVITWCDSYDGGLKPGQTVELECNGGTNNNKYWNAVSGSHSVMAWVDDVNRFPNEVNEDNNKYTATINVQNSVTPTEAQTQAPTQAPTNGVRLYFHADGWSRADLWYWDGASGNAYSSTWPGVALSKVSGTNGWWTVSVSETNFAGFIQQGTTNVGTDKNFADITAAGAYYIVYNGSTETRYSSQSEAESAAGEKLNGSVIVTPTQPSTEGPQPSTGSSEDGRVVGYNVPSGKTTSSNVSMSANGVSVGVFDTTVNNSHTWVGYYPPLSSSRVAIFDFDGTANVTMTVNYNVSSATIRPLADGVTPTITHNGNTTYISFQIRQAGQYSVELNGNLEDAVMIFASKIESAPTGNVIKVSSGEARYGNITVGNGQTLYIEGGGAVYGRVFCQTGSTVCGRGIIDQSHMDTWGGSNGQYPMSIEGCSNVHVSGVSVLNSSCWNYQIWNASYVYLDNIKIVSARPNGDGVSIQSSSNVYVNNSFIRTWDDGIVLKNYTSNNTHDVYCDNIVFWTDLAQSMEIGVETNAGYSGVPANPAIYNVEFTNIDVIHERHKAAISIHNGDNANIYNVKWENVVIEDFTKCGDGWNYWLDFTTCYPTDFGGSAAWAHHWDGTGTIHDITLNNIKVTSSTGAGHRVWDYWASQNRGYSIYNVTCTNVTVNGSAFKY